MNVPPLLPAAPDPSKVLKRQLLRGFLFSVKLFIGLPRRKRPPTQNAIAESGGEIVVGGAA